MFLHNIHRSLSSYLSFASMRELLIYSSDVEIIFTIACTTHFVSTSCDQSKMIATTLDRTHARKLSPADDADDGDADAAADGVNNIKVLNNNTTPSSSK